MRFGPSIGHVAVGNDWTCVCVFGPGMHKAIVTDVNKS